MDMRHARAANPPSDCEGWNYLFPFAGIIPILTAMDPYPSNPGPPPKEESEDGQDQKDEKGDLRQPNRGSGNTAETEDTGDECEDQ